MLREKPNVKWRFISWRIPVEVTRLLLLIPDLGDTKRARSGEGDCTDLGRERNASISRDSCSIERRACQLHVQWNAPSRDE